MLKCIKLSVSSDVLEKDAATVRKTCTAFSIPVSVKISRSGKSVHLWIFFSENIAAKRVRNFGALILQADLEPSQSEPNIVRIRAPIQSTAYLVLAFQPQIFFSKKIEGVLKIRFVRFPFVQTTEKLKRSELVKVLAAEYA